MGVLTHVTHNVLRGNKHCTVAADSDVVMAGNQPSKLERALWPGEQLVCAAGRFFPQRCASPLLLPSAHCDREDTMRCSYLLCQHASNKAAAIVQACEGRRGSAGD